MSFPVHPATRTWPGDGHELHVRQSSYGSKGALSCSGVDANDVPVHLLMYGRISVPTGHVDEHCAHWCVSTAELPLQGVPMMECRAGHVLHLMHEDVSLRRRSDVPDGLHFSVLMWYPSAHGVHGMQRGGRPRSRHLCWTYARMCLCACLVMIQEDATIKPCCSVPVPHAVVGVPVKTRGTGRAVQAPNI